LAVLIFAIITLHGRTTWFDGLHVLVIYLLIALVTDCARHLRPAGAGRKVTVLKGWTSAQVLTSGGIERTCIGAVQTVAKRIEPEGD
jgi:hypothetical protein